VEIHLVGLRRSLVRWNQQPEPLEQETYARDQIVYDLGERTGTIWMTR
jgi:hypothetical protein